MKRKMPSSNYRKPRFPSLWMQRTGQNNSTSKNLAEDDATRPLASSHSFSEFIQQYNLQCRQNRFMTSLSDNGLFFTKDDDDCINGTVASGSSTTRTGSDHAAAARSTTSIDRCCSSHDITLLEPHLAAFCKQQQQQMSTHNQK
jgi:hypothetical protein